MKGQDLENAVLDRDYTRAVRLAFELRKPHKLFELFSEVIRWNDRFCSILICYLRYMSILAPPSNRKPNADVQIEKALRPFDKEEVRLLLEYVREWNTKPKLCHIAQFVLHRLFTILPPTDLVEVLSRSIITCSFFVFIFKYLEFTSHCLCFL